MKGAAAQRIAAHMSWQCLEQDPAWEEEHDKLFLATGIAGTTFVKSAYEPGHGRIMSQLVLPRNLVVNYWTRSLEDSPRYTHTYNLTANAIKQRELDKRFRTVPTKTDDAPGQEAPITPSVDGNQDEITQAKDMRQGLTPGPSDDVTPWFTGEQYCWLDLDNDGYEEPYIVAFDIETGTVRRIVARYLPSSVKFLVGEKLSAFAKGEEYDIPKGAKVYKISPIKVFTKYSFIPSPDGGFYDLGLGSLEGPINATVNTLINQLLDAGTMATLGGGFLGRAFKGRGGPISFAPQQWHPLDAAGEDIRKSVLPLPVREPSNVLFQLLGLLLQYAERIVSASEIQMGESPGQNMKAETVRTLNENGSRVYSGIFKRFWRALRAEYGVRYELNALYLSADEDFQDLTQGRNALIQPDDYLVASLAVRPAADPHVVSDGEAERQATTLVQLSATQPGFNRYKTMKRYLAALRVQNPDEIYPPPMQPGPDGKPQPAPDHPPPPNPKLLDIQIKQGKLELDKQEFQTTLQLQIQESAAKVQQLRAMAAKLLAEADATKFEPLIKIIYAQIESEGKHQDRLLGVAQLMQKHMEHVDGASGQDRGESGMGGMEGSSANAPAAGVSRPNGAGAATPVASS
jgi:hypothetical protein